MIATASQPSCDHVDQPDCKNHHNLHDDGSNYLTYENGYHGWLKFSLLRHPSSAGHMGMQVENVLSGAAPLVEPQSVSGFRDAS